MLGSFLKNLAGIVYPRVCLSCRKKLDVSSINEIICRHCWEKIEKNKPPFCHCCGRNLKKPRVTKGICPECLRRKLHFDRAFSPCLYAGTTKELIHQFKYNRKEHLGPTLSGFMIDFIKEYNLPMEYIDLVVPIPLHKSRLREREFNQAQILSSNICKEFKKDLSSDILLRSRRTKTQTELSFDERLSNIQGSFTTAKGINLKGKNILLIDDVITTGATSSEAALSLKKAGCGIVFVLTLAN
ncbi:MAG: ComF family protein [Candidatus Omnitrophota bacterium]